MNTLPDNTFSHRLGLRNNYPGQFGAGGFNSIYLTGNPDSAVPLCNINDVGMSYYPVSGENIMKNMNDLISKAVDGKMPDKIWESNILNHVPASMRPDDDVTKPYKVRQS